MKFCVNCANCLPTPASSSGVYLCAASNEPDPVTGESHYEFCSVMRLTERCGKQAKLFEEKQLEVANG